MAGFGFPVGPWTVAIVIGPLGRSYRSASCSLALPHAQSQTAVIDTTAYWGQEWECLRESWKPQGGVGGWALRSLMFWPTPPQRETEPVGQNSGLRSFIVRTPAVTCHFKKHSSQRGEGGGDLVGWGLADGGYGASLTHKRHPAQPRDTNDWAPRTRKWHQHRPQQPTYHSNPTQHVKGRTGDRPGPRKGATTECHTGGRPQ